MLVAEVVQVVAGLVVAGWAGNRVNAHRPGTPWLDRITLSLIGAAGVMAILAVPLARMPVIVDAQARVVEHTPGAVRLHVTGTKPLSRAMCDFQSLDAYAVDAAGVHTEVPLIVEHDPRPANTRPPGRQDFGVWRVVYPPELVPQAVLFVAHHRCAWWMPETRTSQGPFKLPEPELEADDGD